MAKITPVELPLRTTIDDLGRKMMADYGDADSEATPAEFYAEAFMENMSEAGYSEARPKGRRSTKALANVVRVNKADLRSAKSLLDYRRGDYHDYALAVTIVDALSTWPRTAPAFALLTPSKLGTGNGPFYPRRTEMRLKTGSNWSFHCLIVPERSPELKESMKALAGVFRVNQRDLNKIAERLLSEDTCQEDLEHKLSEVIIESVRTCPRFARALGWTDSAE